MGTNYITGGREQRKWVKNEVSEKAKTLGVPRRTLSEGILRRICINV